MCSRLLDFCSAAALFAVLMIYYQVPVGPWALLTPLFFVLLLLFTTGVTLATSAVNVFYRDVNPVVQIGLQLWLYLTPVAYALSQVSTRYRWFFVLNPAQRHRRRIPRGAGVRARAGLDADGDLRVDDGGALCRRVHDVQAHGRVLRRRHLASGMAATAIQLDRVSKRYRAGRSRTIVDMVASSIDRLRGKSARVHSAARGDDRREHLGGAGRRLRRA